MEGIDQPSNVFAWVWNNSAYKRTPFTFYTCQQNTCAGHVWLCVWLAELPREIGYMLKVSRCPGWKAWREHTTWKT